MTTEPKLEVPTLSWNPTENARFIGDVYLAAKKAYRDALVAEFKRWDAIEQDRSVSTKKQIAYVAGQLRSKTVSWSGGAYGAGNIAESIEREVLVEILGELARTL